MHSIRNSSKTILLTPRTIQIPVQNRTFIIRTIRSVLKLRYLILGGGVAGTISLNQSYQNFKDALPDMKWLESVLPSEQTKANMYSTVQELKQKIQEFEIDPKLKEASEEQISYWRKWFAEKLEKIDVELPSVDIDFTNSTTGTTTQSSLVDNVVINRGFINAETKPSETSRVESLQDEIIKIQLKYQKELEKLERENKDLRSKLLMKLNSGPMKRPKEMRKSLIDMYSEVLDELQGFDMNYKASDHLPRVVVVGDQSSGKTSVLEMIAQARIFPRGSGEMMTRAPVKVTLSEGPYHIAQFKDSSREFDLTKESDLADLRREVELRMRSSVRNGKSVSNEVISMTVKGPGLSRMVLVDLPGVISTQTLDMAEDTKDSIIRMSMDYMSNPNSIILCIQDGSVDAERSNVTDLVSQMDPNGKRTIFVLTKVDLAEQNLANPQRIQQILSGKLFPMKALGYFAVVTGRGNNSDSIAAIKQYEEEFFRTSKLFRTAGLGSSTQYTTKNLSFAVSERFWAMVRETVEQQADTFKAMRFNLETEWKNNYPRMRELDRDELYEKCRGEVLDQVVNLSLVSAKEWEDALENKLFDAMNNHVFENVFIPACMSGSKSTFNTTVDIRLKQWAEESLAEKCVQIGWEVLKDKFLGYLEKERSSKSHDPIFDQLKHNVVDEAFKRHSWEDKASEVLRVIQLNTLEDRSVNDKVQWDRAVKFMEEFLSDKLKNSERLLHEMVGPGFMERWMYWKSASPEQSVKSVIKSELENIMTTNQALCHPLNLSQEEYNIVRRQLESKGIKADMESIRNTWFSVYRRHFIKNSLNKCYECRKGYWIYSKNVDDSELDCNEVVLFWRIQQMLKVTANALRQQVVNREAKRLEKEIKEVLEEWSSDEEKKKGLLTGRRVTLAEDLKRVRQVQDKLEEFITLLNSEK